MQVQMRDLQINSKEEVTCGCGNCACQKDKNDGVK